MSFKWVSGWVAECDSCGDNVTPHISTKKATLQEIKEDGAFRRNALLICTFCIRRRACRIFGHKPARNWLDICSRCGDEFR